MTKTIENKCKEGKHRILRSIGNQEGVGNLNNFFYCHYCNLRAKVTDAYRKVLKDVYELRQEVEEEKESLVSYFFFDKLTKIINNIKVIIPPSKRYT